MESAKLLWYQAVVQSPPRPSTVIVSLADSAVSDPAGETLRGMLGFCE